MRLQWSGSGRSSATNVVMLCNDVSPVWCSDLAVGAASATMWQRLVQCRPQVPGVCMHVSRSTPHSCKAKLHPISVGDANSHIWKAKNTRNAKKVSQKEKWPQRSLDKGSKVRAIGFVREDLPQYPVKKQTNHFIINLVKKIYLQWSWHSDSGASHALTTCGSTHNTCTGQ